VQKLGHAKPTMTLATSHRIKVLNIARPPEMSGSLLASVCRVMFYL
jgi:hypothetical protein